MRQNLEKHRQSLEKLAKVKTYDSCSGKVAEEQTSLP